MWITINKNSKVPFIRQIYHQFREKILSGEYPAGEKLPSTRELSSSLQVSRNVVLEAYQLLILEGFITTIPQSGTFVAEGAVMTDLIPSPSPSAEEDSSQCSFFEQDSYISLRSGIPDMNSIPLNKWTQFYKEACLDSASSLLGYGNAKGLSCLRNAICNYLRRVRGVSCNPEQIIITSGSMHSFSLLAAELLKTNHSYIIEDPLHNEIKKVFALKSIQYQYVPSDAYGMQTNLLPGKYDPSFILVTPSHQYPLGGCLPIQRRIELIQYARKKNCYIIEDDYDSEFRYDAPPISTLYSLDPNHVIYVGTFSKNLFPTTRIGYMILPPKLVPNILFELRYTTYFTDTLTQLTMTRILEERILERHIAKMRKEYRKKRNFLMQCLNTAFENSIRIYGAETGLHLVVEFKNKTFDDSAISHFSKKNLVIFPVWKHSENPNYPKTQLIFGYSHLTEGQIEKAVKLIAFNE